MIASICSQESQLHKATRIKVSLLADHDWDLKNNIRSNAVFAGFGVCSGCAPLKMLYRMPGFMMRYEKSSGSAFQRKRIWKFQYYRFYVESQWLAYKSRRNLFIVNYILHDSLTSSNLHFATQDFRRLEFRVLMNKKTAPLDGHLESVPKSIINCRQLEAELNDCFSHL